MNLHFRLLTTHTILLYVLYIVYCIMYFVYVVWSKLINGIALVYHYLYRVMSWYVYLMSKFLEKWFRNFHRYALLYLVLKYHQVYKYMYTLQCTLYWQKWFFHDLQSNRMRYLNRSLYGAQNKHWTIFQILCGSRKHPRIFYYRASLVLGDFWWIFFVINGKSKKKKKHSPYGNTTDYTVHA